MNRPVLTLLAVSAAAVAAQASDWTSMVVFGDSLSDTGNTLSLVGRPTHRYYSRGRWTDGSDNTAIADLGMQTSDYMGVWHEQLARRLEIPAITNSRAGGARATNYAYGGATSPEGINTIRIFNSDVEVGRNLGTQVRDYVTATPAGLSPDALYITWAGGNDVRDAATANGATANSVRQSAVTAAQNVSTSIRFLMEHARPQDRITILWPNIPSLGVTPESQGWAAGIRVAAGQAAGDFDQEQNRQMAALRRDFANLTLFKLDVKTMYEQLLANQLVWVPANKTDNIINAGDFSGAIFNPQRNGNVAGNINPDDYVFWDQLHPTAHVHSLLGDYAACVVPAPGSLALLAAGMLTAARRRRPARAIA
jgi:outer membrane lipase/esterase